MSNQYLYKLHNDGYFYWHTFLPFRLVQYPSKLTELFTYELSLLSQSIISMYSEQYHKYMYINICVCTNTSLIKDQFKVILLSYLKIILYFGSFQQISNYKLSKYFHRPLTSFLFLHYVGLIIKYTSIASRLYVKVHVFVFL